MRHKGDVRVDNSDESQLVWYRILTEDEPSSGLVDCITVLIGHDGKLRSVDTMGCIRVNEKPAKGDTHDWLSLPVAVETP